MGRATGGVPWIGRGVAARGERGVEGTSAAKVSPLESKYDSSPSSVSALASPEAAPQREQNFAVAVSLFPQFEQNMDPVSYHPGKDFPAGSRHAKIFMP